MRKSLVLQTVLGLREIKKGGKILSGMGEWEALLTIMIPRGT